ncbi:hypothetical protein DH2020_014954 [Rehmannia glutinosa]|uniref:non-specific serine/threonine protein kinase n=1 Tax=Rehmannia glutinosa TaxID=99300 RepID=A0ABR0WYR6_REHGL
MGSFRVNCEITEEKEEQSTSRRPQTFRLNRDQQKPPILKKGYNKTLEDDINKLFEAVNLRSSKSLDLSDTPRNASKKPMRGSGSSSPVIGFSEPVSLKQALRGLCISQAAEMAAIKRSSMPASPRISEAGKITNMYRSVVVETGEPGGSPLERRIEISLVPEENSSKNIGHNSRDFDRPQAEFSDVGICLVEGDNATCSASKQSLCFQDSNTKSSIVHNDIVHNDISTVSEIDVQLVGKGLKEEDCSLVPVLPHDKAFDNFSKRDEKVSGSNKVPPSVAEKAAPKLRRKSRLQTVSSSSAVKGNKDVNSTRNTSRAVKPVIRNKNLIIKKPKKLAVPKVEIFETSHEVNSVHDKNSGPLICQKCQCSLRDTSESSGKPDSIPTVKTSMLSKSSEKADISQSSKSSICDFSSSTTSLSDESNMSGSTFSNRPHMSKDMRWEAINHVRKQYGFLGLSHFNLLKKLGSGDIGTVYLAELIGMNCLFAIKVMDNEFLARRKKMPRAQTEREILRMLDHPFLPTLYAQFTSDNLSCLVMEFCPGGDLHVLRQKQPGRYFPEHAARFYVAEVLLALEYLHMLGIVYRDLKPENILVREDGHIMLTDFDLSLRCSVNPTLLKSSSLKIEPPRISGPCAGSNCIDPFCNGPSCKMSCFSPRLLPATAKARKLKAEAAAAAQARSLPQLVAEPTEARSNSFVGTHEYLAPEIIKGEGHGSAVDWWTFGVFLYELLYGRTPFKGADNEETLTNVVLQNLRFPDYPIVSFQARDLIRGLLVKEPENRLGTETGAAEIKRHSFFEGLNWALIRCAVPPEVPEVYDVEVSSSREKGKGYLDCGVNGEQLEFELF